MILSASSPKYCVSKEETFIIKFIYTIINHPWCSSYIIIFTKHLTQTNKHLNRIDLVIFVFVYKNMRYILLYGVGSGSQTRIVCPIKEFYQKRATCQPANQLCPITTPWPRHPTENVHWNISSANLRVIYDGGAFTEKTVLSDAAIVVATC